MTAGADAVGIVMVGADVAGIATVFGVADLLMKGLDAADSTAVVASTVETAFMTEEASTVKVVSTEVEAFTEAACMVEVAPTAVVTVEADPTEAMADTAN